MWHLSFPIWRKRLIDTSVTSIANATGDLLMMAAWSLASEKIGEGDPVPVRRCSSPPHLAYHVDPLIAGLSDVTLLLPFRHITLLGTIVYTRHSHHDLDNIGRRSGRSAATVFSGRCKRWKTRSKEEMTHSGRRSIS